MKKSNRKSGKDVPVTQLPTVARRTWTIPLICLALIAVNLFIYAPVRHYPLINYDDPAYVGDNPMVKRGLTSEGLAWAFTTDTQNNWHPLTWLSHMLDVQLFGMNAGMHHVTNVFFHIANTLLLFWAFYRMTGDAGRSAFAAALFGVHPTHVQSVAWVSERKDVLSALFWILTILAYSAYVRKPGWQRYLLVVAALAAGLAAKPMLVSLPLILLLMDFWPLARIPLDGTWRRALPRLLWEKVPLLLLVVVSSVMTFVVQSRGAAAKLENLSLGARVENALQSYLAYIGKMFWPTDLALIYPYRFNVPVWKTAAALVVLTGITVVAVWFVRRRPYVLVGWLWYGISLVPVIGLVQVGVQGMADRYTYIPFVGLFVVIAWALPKLHAVVPLVVVGILAITARGQVELWQSSIGLWNHTVRVTVQNPQAQINLANELLKNGQDLDAVAHFLEAVRLDPRFLEAHYNLGITLLRLGRTEEAATYFRQAIAINPDYADAHNNLGFVLAVQRKPEEAERHYSEALRVNPEHVEAQSNIAVLLMQLGRTDEALRHFEEALRLNPSSAKAHNNLACALATQGRIDEAIQEYTEALRIDPGYADARNRLEALKRFRAK